MIFRRWITISTAEGKKQHGLSTAKHRHIAGDGLLNYAYETAAKAFDYAADADDMKRIAEALRLLASKPGIGGMLGGQAVDVMSEGKPLDKPLLDLF